MERTAQRVATMRGDLVSTCRVSVFSHGTYSMSCISYEELTRLKNKGRLELFRLQFLLDLIRVVSTELNRSSEVEWLQSGVSE